MLGDSKTHQRAVEIQLKFLQDQDIRDLPFSSLSKEQVKPVFSQMKTSVTDPVYDVSSAAEHVSLSQGPVTKGNLWFTTASLSVYHHKESITFILSVSSRSRIPKLNSNI